MIDLTSATPPKTSEKTSKQDSSSSSGKKMKQLRLPFTPVNLVSSITQLYNVIIPISKLQVQVSPGTAKRKRSEDTSNDGTPNKVIIKDRQDTAEKHEEKREEKHCTPRRVQTVFLGKGKSETGTSPGAKKKISLPKKDPKKDQNGMTEAKSKDQNECKEAAKDQNGKSKENSNANDGLMSQSAEPEKTSKDASDKKKDVIHHKATEASPQPSEVVVKDRITSLKVEAAVLAVTCNELNEEMNAAADAKDFLRAASLKEEIDEKLAEKEALLAAAESTDLNRMNAALAKAAANRAPVKPSTSKKRTAMPSQKEGGDSTSKVAKKLTPKQEARKAELQRKKDEKEKEKEDKAKEKEEKKKDKELKKEQEKLKKEEEKKMKEQQREEERKRKEEEKEAEKKAKEEVKKEKEAKKEAEKLAKEEEKRKKEEEKKKMEETEKAKAAKEAMSFKKFFFKRAEEKKEAETPCTAPNHLQQFRVKANMRLAPSRRSPLDQKERETLENALQVEAAGKLFLDDLNHRKARQSTKTWPAEDTAAEDAEEVEIIEEEEEASGKILMAAEEEEAKVKQRVHCKFLQFYDNVRPAYRGTWSKQSTQVTGRRPFGKDSAILDYDYDSEADWEEEPEEGDSLSDEEKDKEEDEEDAEEEEDDGFFVDHGVLDKDEMHLDDEDDDGEEGGGGGAIEYDEELEQKKQRLRAQEFEEGHKKKVSKIKPRIFGCFWMGEERANDAAATQLLKLLSPFAAVPLGVTPIKLATESDEAGDEHGQSAEGKGKRMKSFPEEAVKDLIRLVHVNTNSKGKLAKEFAAFLKGGMADDESNTGTPSCSSVGGLAIIKIIDKIIDIAKYKSYEGEGPMQGKSCWVVKPEVLDKYDMKNVPVPNAWQYSAIKPRRRSDIKEAKIPKPQEQSPPVPEKKNAASGPSSIQSLFHKMEEAKKQTHEECQVVAEITKPQDNQNEQVKEVDDDKITVAKPEKVKEPAKEKKRMAITTLFSKKSNEQSTVSTLSNPPEKKRVALQTLSSKKAGGKSE